MYIDYSFCASCRDATDATKIQKLFIHVSTLPLRRLPTGVRQGDILRSNIVAGLPALTYSNQKKGKRKKGIENKTYILRTTDKLASNGIIRTI